MPQGMASKRNGDHQKSFKHIAGKRNLLRSALFLAQQQDTHPPYATAEISVMGVGSVILSHLISRLE